MPDDKEKDATTQKDDDKKIVNLEDLKAQAQDVLAKMGQKMDDVTIKVADPTTPVPADPADADPSKAGATVPAVPTPAAPGIVSADILKPSRSYSFCRAFKAILTRNWQEASIEWQMSEWLRSIGMCDDAIGLLVPIDVDNLPITADEANEIKAVMKGNVKHKMAGLRLKALGEDTDTAGGYLVQQEQSAEIIELIRAQAVVSAAGAREIPLPRSGILSIPRQTGGGTANWIGEATTITDSSQTFGQLLLVAKKCAALIKLSNELIADSTPAVEAVVREDLARVIALKEDLAFLRGAGTTTEPRGITNHDGVTLVALGTNGAVPDADSYTDLFVEVEANDGQVTAVITHPRLKHQLRKTKDTAGQYIWSPPTTMDPPNIWGVPTNWTSQLPVNLVKGSATNCTEIIAGMMSEAVIGRKAVLELDISTQGDTPFQAYQTWIRAITRVDFGLRTENVFAYIADAKIA